MTNYDTILHLAGDTALPMYLAIKQSNCPRHILAVTHESESAFHHLQRVLNRQEVHTEKLNVSPHDYGSCHKRLSKLLNGLPEGRTAIDISGGTRTMTAALLDLARARQLPVFYLDLPTRTINWVQDDRPAEPIQPVMQSVSEYVDLAGLHLDAAQVEERHQRALTRRDVAMNCWTYRSQLHTWSHALRPWARKPGAPFKETQKIQGTEFSALLKRPKDGHKGVLHLGEHHFSLKPWPRLAAFLCGDWYRDAVFNSLHQTQGVIKDIQVAVQLHEQDAEHPSGPLIDIVYTDGIGLTLIATRLARVEGSLVHQLQQQAQLLGGACGTCMIATVEDKHPALAPGLRHLSGAATVAHPERFFD